MPENEKKNRKLFKNLSLRRKTFYGMLILGLVLIIGMGLVVYHQAREKMLDHYEDLAFSFTRTAAAFIDPERIKVYLETNQTDDYYDTVKQYLDAALKETKFIYYSIYIPTSDDTIYIWHGENQDDHDEEDEKFQFGNHDPYAEGESEYLLMIYAQEISRDLLITRDSNGDELAIALTPIFDKNNKPIAVAEVNVSMDSMRAQITGVMTSFMTIALLIIIPLMIFSLYMTRTILGPIRKLDQAAAELVPNLKSNNLFVTDIHTGDEIEDLAHSFEKMDTELRAYIAENNAITAEKEHIGTELSLAARIQEDMLPNTFPAFPEKPEIDIYAVMRPAREVGGDFYDYFLIDDRHLGLVIADVSGKGIPASLFMMKSMITIQNSAMSGNSPKQVLEEANNELCRHNQERMFVTVWFGILDLDTGILTAANGGHEYPFFKQPEQAYELFKDKHGFVLGGMADMRYTEYTMEMKPGTSLFVYTDGVPEANNENGELFGLDRTLGALNLDPEGSPQQILENVEAEVAGFVRKAPRFDDMTMLCFQFKGKTVYGS